MYEEEKVQIDYDQKPLSHFKTLPKQNMLLNLNPIPMTDGEEENQSKLYIMRDNMEDPTNIL